MLYRDSQAGWGGVMWGIVPKPNHVVQLVDKIEILPIAMDAIALICQKPDEDSGLDFDLVCAPPNREVDWGFIGYSDSGDRNEVRFAVYTWAEGHRQVPENPNKPLKLKDFLWNYYGYLAFKD